MGMEEKNKELTDIALCYQSMGIELDASPAEIERMYQSLTQEFKKKLASPNHALREEARLSLEQVKEMYEKIRDSTTYHAMEKEYLKKKADPSFVEAKLRRPVHKTAPHKSLTMQCPRCNGSITKGLKTCPICKSPLHSAMEKILSAYFTPKKLIIYCIIVSVASLVVFGLLHPERFSGTKPEVDFMEQNNK